MVHCNQLIHLINCNQLYLNSTHRKKFIFFYSTCFLLSYCWLAFNGLLLHQLKPVFFTSRLDVSLNILALTGLQNAIIGNHFLQLLFDGIYFLIPLLLVFTCIINSRIQFFIALLNSLFNLAYALLLSSLSTLSIEGFVCWIILPLIFIFKKDRAFYFAVNCTRYIFLLIFFSSGLWKIRAGGLFNTEQMGGVLLLQHTAYLATVSHDWFSSFIIYLIKHPLLSYAIYLAATMAELFFVVGFFTKKLDNVLMVLFLLFVITDLFLMRINYFAWISFLGCLWFAKYKEPEILEFKD